MTSISEIIEPSRLCRIRPLDNTDMCVQAPPPRRRKHALKVRIEEEANEEYSSCYNEQDISNAWMSQRDYANIKQNNRETLMTIIKSLGGVGKLDANVCCLRGLESHIEMFYTDSKKEVRKRSIERVLSDQESMRASGSYNANALAGGYREASKYACKRGLELAYIDALA